MTSSLGKTEKLWTKAVNSLNPSNRDQLDASRTAKLDVVGAVLKVAEAKRDLTLRRRLKVRKPDGEEIVIRDVVEKIIKWIHRFRDVGDIAVQYPSAHASLPWAAIRFVLQVAISEREIFGEHVEGLEYVTKLVVRFRYYEELFLPPLGSSGLAEETLVKLYTVMLEYLADAVKFFRQSTTSRLLQSPFHKPNHELMDEILNCESDILRISDLAQMTRLLAMETHIHRLQTQSEEHQQVVSREQHSMLSRWLSTVPYLEHHREHQTDRVQNTGDWLLHHPSYQMWATSSASSIFLLHGIAGSGKSKVCSTIVDQFYQISLSARYRQAPVAFFYCAESSFEPERGSTLGVLKSLVCQLATRMLPKLSVHHSISALYKKREEEAEAFEVTTLSIPECIAIILESLDENPAYLIIDAIDELAEPGHMLECLSEIQYRARNVVKIFITSRDTRRVLSVTPQFVSQLHIEPGLNAVDVRSFVAREVNVAKHTRRLLFGDVPPDLENQLVDSLCSGAGENFLWVKLQIDQLARLRNEQGLRNALADFETPTIAELLSKTVDSILHGGDIALHVATRAFAWLLYMREPLYPDAFRSTVSSGTHTVELETLLNVCHNTIYLDASLHVFRFAHHSIQQYLREQPFLTAPIPQQILTSSCLTFCSVGPPQAVWFAAPRASLYDYAAMYWGHHLAALNTSSNASTSVDGIENLLFATGDQMGLAGRAWMNFVQTTCASLPWNHLEKSSCNFIVHDGYCPFLPLCVYGLHHLLENHPWSPDFDFDQKNAFGQTALYLACFFGHQDTVAFLLDHNVNVNVRCGKYGSPLHCAAFRGHQEVTKMLLRRGADPDHGKWESVVHAALDGNHELLAWSLLNDVKLKTLDQVDALLEVSAKGGFEKVMTWLLQYPLKATGKTDREPRMLREAINSGKVSSVEFIQRISSIATTIPHTGLIDSAFRGHAAMTSYLLDQGQDPNVEAELGTALRCASLNGHLEVCQILLDRGADVNHSSDSRGGALGSALHAACVEGHAGVVKLLIRNGANVNQKGGYYGTAAQAAAFHNHIDVLDMLARSGADVNISGLFNNALCAAFEGCSYDAVEFMLDQGLVPSHETMMQFVPGPQRQEPSRNILFSPAHVPLWKRNTKKDPTKAPAGPDARIVHDPNVLVARTGRLDLVNRIFDRHDLTVQHDGDTTRVVLEAYGFGHSHIVSQLLKRRDCNRECFRAILKAAATKDDRDTFNEVLRRMNERFPGERHDRDAVLMSYPSLSISRALLSDVKSKLSGDEFSILLKNCLWNASSEGYMQSLSDGLLHDHSFHKEDLVLAFEIACYQGQEVAVSLLYEYLPRGDTVTETILDSVWRAFDNRYIGIIEFLCDCLVQRGAIETNTSRLILHACREGTLEFLEAHLKRPVTVGEDTLQAALSLAANFGHAAICQFLIASGADPNTKSRIPVFDVFTPKPPQPPKDLIESDCTFLTMYRVQDVNRMCNQASQAPSLFTPIDSCLQGFEAHRMTEEQFAQTMSVLSTSAAPVSDLIFCRAVSVSPYDVIQSLMERGANANAASDFSNSITIAAQREHMQFEIVKLLLKGRLQRDLTLGLDQSLLNHSLDRFSESEELGFFAETPSLSDIFSTGPGATISFLLQQKGLALPQDNRSALYLQCAAAAGEEQIVRMVLHHGVDVNVQCGYYGAALQAASTNGFLEIVRILIDAGADLNAVGGPFGTALHAAVCSADTARYADLDRDHLDPLLMEAKKKRQIELSLYLLQAGADPSLPLDNQTSTLLEACRTGDERLVAALLNSGADIQAVGTYISCGNPGPSRKYHMSGLRTALHNAIVVKSPAVARTLLSRGFDFSANVSGKLPPLVFAADVGCPEILDILLNAMPDVALRASVRALPQAVYKGDLFNIEKFLSRRAFTDSLISNVECLRAACEIADVRVLEMLLDRLARIEGVVQSLEEIMHDPWFKHSQHFALMLEYIICPTILFVNACMHGWTDVVRIALAQKIDINAQDSKGRIGLHIAAAFGRVDIVRLLLAHGADVHQTSERLGTPLLTALESLSANKVLGKYTRQDVETPDSVRNRVGCIFDIKATDGSWIIHFGYQRNLSDIPQTEQVAESVSLLMSSGADPMSCQGPLGYPVHIAAFHGHMGILDMVMDEGLDPTMSEGILGTVLAAAIQGDSLEALERLVSLSHPSVGTESTLGSALIVACQSLQPRSANFLLHCGAEANFTAVSGSTPFDALIESLSGNRSRPGWDGTKLILNLLLGADPPLRTGDHHADKIVQVKVVSVRDELIQMLFAGDPDLGVSAELAARLIKGYTHGDQSKFLDHLIAHRRLPALNEDMLFAANVDMLPRLLEYDRSYTVTSSLIHAVSEYVATPDSYSRYDRNHDRMLALIKHSSYVPTEDDIVDLCSSAMRHQDLAKESDLAEIIDRNPDMPVTGRMLNAANNTADMGVLLDRMTPGQELFTDDVFQNAAKQGTLVMLLERYNGRPISRETAADGIRKYPRTSLELLKRVVALDPGFPIDEHVINALFFHNGPTKILEVLESHGKRFEMTERLRYFIDVRLRHPQERDLLMRFYQLADSESSALLEPPDLIDPSGNGGQSSIFSVPFRRI